MLHLGLTSPELCHASETHVSKRKMPFKILFADEKKIHKRSRCEVCGSLITCWDLSTFFFHVLVWC